MKAFILLIVVTVTSMVAISNADKNISGTWVIEQGDSKLNPPVLRITMGEGIWEGKIDMPAQQVYDRKVHSIIVDKDSVFITVYKGGPTVNAKMLNNTLISGEMLSETGKEAVLLKKKGA